MTYCGLVYVGLLFAVWGLCVETEVCAYGFVVNELGDWLALLCCFSFEWGWF